MKILTSKRHVFAAVLFPKVVVIVAHINAEQVHLHQSNYDAAAVMNAAVFKMLICRNEMHNTQPFGYCSQRRCIIAALLLQPRAV